MNEIEKKLTEKDASSDYVKIIHVFAEKRDKAEKIKERKNTGI